MLAATLATAALAATSITIDVRDTGEIRRVGDLKPRQYLGERASTPASSRTAATRSAPTDGRTGATRTAAGTSGAGSGCS